MDYTISAVDRALLLLEALAERPGLSLSELARETGNTKSLVFRLVHTLEGRGYVIRDPVSKTYTLGYRHLYLAASAQDHLSLITTAAPFLDTLAERSGENVNLIVRDGLHSVCIALRESPHTVRLYAQVGRRGPLHAGGGPKILLAFAPDDVREAVLGGHLPAFTEHTLVTREALQKRLDAIRISGSNESDGDLDRDAFSIAAAIRGRAGEVIAALSVAGPVSRLDRERADLHRGLVRSAARGVSEALGWRPKLLAAI